MHGRVTWREMDMAPTGGRQLNLSEQEERAGEERVDWANGPTGAQGFVHEANPGGKRQFDRLRLACSAHTPFHGADGIPLAFGERG